jgi:hypothetical protein
MVSRLQEITFAYLWRHRSSAHDVATIHDLLWNGESILNYIGTILTLHPSLETSILKLLESLEITTQELITEILFCCAQEIFNWRSNLTTMAHWGEWCRFTFTN